MHLDLEAISHMHPIFDGRVQGSPYKKASCSTQNPCYLIPFKDCKSSQSLCPDNDDLKFGVKLLNMVCGIAISNEFMFTNKWHFLSLVNEKTMIENIVILFENEFKRWKVG